MRKYKPITGGVYLVLDPGMHKSQLLQKVQEALDGGVSVLQIWNNWPAGYTWPDKLGLVQELVALADVYRVPVLVNEEWQLLKETDLGGVHFDHIPPDYEALKAELNRDFICGITCSNNLEVVRWAEQHQLDYVSFCAVFPSPSAGSCEIVQADTIREARKITQMPLFLSGGITAENLTKLQELDFNGVAVISGILNAASAKESTAAYKQALNNYNP
ncbi:thiamine phosphate synthase [Pontibacter ramchanderi]|uniref:Thiamine-phosphate diphosphorylase n=1 Tax=Pontibacter ramchanderi TaxID=1179743 RepID=A0A2N3U951_9BACT|nr:thiamine phosphate synthase [Pontibacter ramchanderi]PKV63265.1 thiamine-phosphate diphosphorylase [Pontibacter ramchanderi]